MKVILTVITLIFSSFVIAQKKDKPTELKWNKTSEVYINYEVKNVLASATVSKDSIIKLNILPEKMMITIPPEGIDNVWLKFNAEGDENKFQLASSCKDSKSCEVFLVSDLNHGILELTFYKGQLIKIGNRSINPRPIKEKEPFIKMLSSPNNKVTASNEESKNDLSQGKVSQKTLDTIEINKLNEYIKCFLCNTEISSCIINNESIKDPYKNEADSKLKKIFRRNYYTYIGEIDAESGKKSWFKKDKNNNITEVHDISTIHPWAGSEFILNVKGSDTTKYLINLAGESFFMDNQNNFKNSFMGPGTKDSTKKTEPDTTKSKKQGEQNNNTDQPESDKNKIFKGKFLALDKILEKFNSKYKSIDFIEVGYHNELAQLQQGIKSCLSIPLTNSADDLAVSLKLLVATQVDSMYFKEFLQFIAAITQEYKNATNKVSHRKMFYISKQVPDEDKFKLSLQTDKSNDKLFEYDFWVKGGLKIDFSSGVFINGLGNPEYLLQKFNFSYRETRDSVVVVGGSPKDTAIYTGKVNTTSGQFIKTNENKLNYGAGFFAHVYRRSGRPFNWGIGVGAALNNTGQITGMLGLSTMLNSGKGGRIVLSGGTSIGKVKTLSNTETDFIVKPDYTLHDHGQIIYNNIREVPKFYDPGNTSSINTYDKWRVNWFIGLSFNFASINVASK